MGDLGKATDKYRKTASAAELMEEKVQKEIKVQKQQDNDAKPNEDKIRDLKKAELAMHIDKAIAQRRHRIQLAKTRRSTTDIWKLLVAAIEQAFVEYFELKDQNANAMRGRQNPRIQKVTQKPEKMSNPRTQSPAEALRVLANHYGAQSRRMAHVVARRKLARSMDDQQNHKKDRAKKA